MPVELTIVETELELGQTTATVILESASEPGPAGPGVPAGGTDGQVLTKTSSTDYATAWEDATGGGGGAPADAGYLVTASDPTLSAEVVVGATPGGELGGTWGSPTVDTIHSGSSHAATQAAAEATAAGALAAHEADTTNIHGIVDTSALALTANVQPLDSDLTAIAGLTPTNDDVVQRKAGAWTNRSIAQLLVDLAAAGTTFQPLDSDLTALAGLAIAADTLPYGSGSHTMALATFTSFARSLLDDADAAAGRATLVAAPAAAKYIVQTADSELSAEQALGALATGILKNTTTTGVLSIATAGTDYYAPGSTDVALADGGTGASLSDPNADRIMFWDDSAGQVTWLTPGTGLTITGTTIDAAGGGSGSKHYPIQLLNPRSSTLAGNAFFTVLALTDWDAGHWEFVKDVDGKIYGEVRVPNAYASGGVIRLAIAANATSGVTRLGVGTKAVADGESLNPTLTDETKQDITVPGTAYLRKDVTFTLTETLAADDLLLVEIFHEGSHANDTLAQNTLLFGAWLEVTA